mgnify:FL=1
MPKAMLREVAMDCVSEMAQHLPDGCQLFVIACRPGSVDFDLVLPSPEANLNNALDALRRQGLSIDGSNIYKDAVCDLVVGALAMGKQNNNHPPEGHWGQRFWDIGRAEGEQQEHLLSELEIARNQRDALLGAAEEALAVIDRIKPAGNGNGTLVRLNAAIAKAMA